MTSSRGAPTSLAAAGSSAAPPVRGFLATKHSMPLSDWAPYAASSGAAWAAPFSTCSFWRCVRRAVALKCRQQQTTQT
uniref:Putative secreted protein n=1 Tax=Ixodes ricinus TaxID=34613 RepID=A0A6B0TWY1_IXORI